MFIINFAAYKIYHSEVYSFTAYSLKVLTNNTPVKSLPQSRENAYVNPYYWLLIRADILRDFEP